MLSALDIISFHPHQHSSWVSLSYFKEKKSNTSRLDQLVPTTQQTQDCNKELCGSELCFPSAPAPWRTAMAQCALQTPLKTQGMGMLLGGCPVCLGCAEGETVCSLSMWSRSTERVMPAASLSPQHPCCRGHSQGGPQTGLVGGPATG